MQAGAVKRLENDAERAQRLVYAQAVLFRAAHAKRFPRYDEVFRPSPQKRQTPTEVMQVMRMWTSAMRAKHGD